MVVLIGVIVSVMCVFLLRMYTLAAVSPDERAVADADSMTYQTTDRGRARLHSGPQRQRAGLQPRNL